MRYVIRAWALDTVAKSGLKKIRGEMVVSAESMGEAVQKLMTTLEGRTKKAQAGIGRIEVFVQAKATEEKDLFGDL